jgi:hypothetical protein
MRFLIALAVFFYSFCASAATLGQFQFGGDRDARECSGGNTPTPVSVEMNLGSSGRHISVNWEAISSVYAVRWELWYCAGSGCSNYVEIQRWPDDSAPDDVNQDWLFCYSGAGCFLTTAQSGRYMAQNLNSGIHRFQLRFSKFNSSCEYVSNRILQLQEIIP